MKKRLYIIFNLLLVITLIVGLTLAWMDFKKSTRIEPIKSELNVFYATGSDISFNSLIKSSEPDINNNCLNNECYRNDFVVSNLGELNGILNGSMTITKNEYENSKLMYSIYNGDVKIVDKTPITSNSFDLFKNISIEENKSINIYTLFIWLDETSNLEKQYFNGNINIIGKKNEKGSYAYYDISKSSIYISKGTNANKLLVKGIESSSEIKFQNNSDITEKEIDKTIKIVLTGTTNINNIIIDGVDVNLFLSNVNIDLSSKDDVSALSLINNANVKLNIFNSNKIISSTNKEGIEFLNDSKLIINGNGYLETFNVHNLKNNMTINETLKPIYKCENNELNNSYCEMPAKAKYSCSNGTLSEKSCVKNATLKYSCENGTLNENDRKCYYQFYSKQCLSIDNCSNNTLPEGEKLLCDQPGWTKTKNLTDEFGSVGVECSHSSESKYACDENWTNTGTTCKKDAEVTYLCESGTLNNSKCITPAILEIN